jgi:hypothetical protein
LGEVVQRRFAGPLSGANDVSSAPAASRPCSRNLEMGQRPDQRPSSGSCCEPARSRSAAAREPDGVTDIIVHGQPRPRFDGRCFFCDGRLGLFGANVKSTNDRLLGYACDTCANQRAGPVGSHRTVAVRDLPQAMHGRCDQCGGSRVVVANLTFDDGTVEKVCARCRMIAL